MIGGLILDDEVLLFVKAVTRMMASSAVTEMLSTRRRSGHVSSVLKPVEKKKMFDS